MAAQTVTVIAVDECTGEVVDGIEMFLTDGITVFDLDLNTDENGQIQFDWTSLDDDPSFIYIGLSDVLEVGSSNPAQLIFKPNGNITVVFVVTSVTEPRALVSNGCPDNPKSWLISDDPNNPTIISACEFSALYYCLKATNDQFMDCLGFESSDCPDGDYIYFGLSSDGSYGDCGFYSRDVSCTNCPGPDMGTDVPRSIAHPIGASIGDHTFTYTVTCCDEGGVIYGKDFFYTVVDRISTADFEFIVSDLIENDFPDGNASANRRSRSLSSRGPILGDLLSGLDLSFMNNKDVTSYTVSIDEFDQGGLSRNIYIETFNSNQKPLSEDFLFSEHVLTSFGIPYFFSLSDSERAARYYEVKVTFHQAACNVLMTVKSYFNIAVGCNGCFTEDEHEVSLHSDLGGEGSDGGIPKVDISSGKIDFNVSHTFIGDADIIDLSGRIIRSENISTEAFYNMDIQGLSPGIYFLRVRSDDGYLRSYKFVQK